MEKKLYRSTQNKVIAGVCGGVGEYFEIDPVIVRLLVVVFTLVGGSGLIAYIIAMLIIPVRRGPEVPGEYNEAYAGVEGVKNNCRNESPGSYEKTNRNTAMALGFILIIIGGLIVVRYFVHWIPSGLIFAAALVLAGLFLIFKRL
ncbi:PspC domain-containing protein [Bacillota bacterium]